MKTYRDLYSDVIGQLRSVNIDSFISPKGVISMFIAVASDFIKKDENYQLINLTEGWKKVECLPLREVSITECNIDAYLCSKLMKSVDRVPESYVMKNRQIIRTVSSIDFGNFYEPTTPKGWKNIQKRKDKSGKKYFFFENGYLFIPVPKGDLGNPEAITMEIYAKYPWEVDVLNLKNKQGCDSCKTDTLCVKPLDYEVVVPEYLYNAVKQEVIRQLQNSQRIVSDAAPDINENIKINQNQ